MRAPAFVIAQGDRLPSLVVELGDTYVKQDLTTASSVAGYMVHLASGEKVTLDVDVTDAEHGQVTVAWGATDTAVPGMYRLYFVATFAGGKMTFPSCPDGPDEVLVEVCAAG